MKNCKLFQCIKQVYDYISTLPSDKILHNYVSFLLTLIVNLIAKNLLITSAIVLGICILKEIIDYFDYGRKARIKIFLKDSLKDLLFDTLGIIMGVVYILISQL